MAEHNTTTSDGTTELFKGEAWFDSIKAGIREVKALIASAYLAGTNTRRVKRALAPLCKGAVGKDVDSRAWRKVRRDGQKVLLSIKNMGARAKQPGSMCWTT